MSVEGSSRMNLDRQREACGSHSAGGGEVVRTEELYLQSEALASFLVPQTIWATGSHSPVSSHPSISL